MDKSEIFERLYYIRDKFTDQDFDEEDMDEALNHLERMRKQHSRDPDIVDMCNELVTLILF